MFEPYTDSATKYSDNIKSNENNAANTANTANNNKTTDTKTTDAKKTDAKTTDAKKDDSKNNSNSKESENSTSKLFNTIFNKTTFFYLFLFLGIYIFAYFMLGVFFNKGGDASSFQINLSRTIDILFCAFLLIFIVSYIYSPKSNNLNSSINKTFDGYLVFLTNPTSILTSFLF